MSRTATMVLIGVLAAGASGVAQTPRSDVRDRVEIRITAEPARGLGPGDSLAVGDPFWVTVRTRGPGGTYLLPQSLVDGYGGHPEMAIVGRDRRDGALRLQVALFRPGAQTLPTIDARVTTADGDTIRVPVVSDTIHVASVLAPGDTLLADLKPLWTRGAFPAWIWWVLAALVVLAILAWWWRRRRRAGGDVPAVVTHRTAHERAIAALEGFRVDPPTPDRRTAAATAIGDIVRIYLVEGWGIAARERTTLELMPRLPDRARPVRPALASLLSTIDLSKFARVAPDPGLVPTLAESAIEIVGRLEPVRDETEPVVEETAS